MPYDYQRSAHSSSSVDVPAGRPAPGKRSLTQSLPPRASSLRDEQREVADFDDGIDDGFYDARATVESKPTELLLTDQQLRKARRRNPMWVERLRVSAQIFSTAAPDSDAFALDVAEKQAAQGLTVDGIAGPNTVAAVAAEATAKRSAREPTGNGEPREVADFDQAVGSDFYDQRATVEVGGGDATNRFAADDPFGMHLLGEPG